MEQRSEEWYLARKGKITASECYLLLGNHKEPMTEEELAEFKATNPKSRTTTKEVPFSEGSFSYLNKKVAERLMSNNNFLEYMDARDINTRATSHGIFWEDTARINYSLRTGNKVEQVGFIPLEGAEDYCGGSPDGVTGNGIIEIKCPWNSEVHLDYMLFETPEDLKEYSLQYYAQIQLNILVTGSDHGDFISYDPRLADEYQMKVLRIPADEEFQLLLKERIALAQDYINERISKINDSKRIML